MTKKKIDNPIKPETFYRNQGNLYKHPTNKINLIEKKKEVPESIDPPILKEEVHKKSFDSKGYKKKVNKELEDIGSKVRVYDKGTVNLLLTVLIGVIVIFGLFFVWGVSNDKFKSELDCPDCICEESIFTCPQITIPDCNCNQNLVCPELNESFIVSLIETNSNCSNSS